MRRRSIFVALAGFVSQFAVLLAQGQGTITDPPASYTIPTSHYDSSPAANFTGVGPTLATDHLFETGWWYRLAGDPSEKFLPVTLSPNFPTGTSYTVTWTNVDGRGFNSTEVGSVTNGGGPSGTMAFFFTVSNPGASPVVLDLFNLLDVDLAGSAPSDSAVLVAANFRIGVTDGSQFAEYMGLGAGAFLVRAYGATDVGEVLSDAAFQDFDSTGLPFGPGDITAGFQWADVVLAPGGSRTLTVALAVNMANAYATWLFLDGFESGNTHVWSSVSPP